MSLRLVRTLSTVEQSSSYHTARILLLLYAGGGRSRKQIDGLTKLAKMDFLLRYPNCLERALSAVHRDVQDAHILDFERTTIESRMVRFRYGPWDGRYRMWIGILQAKGLVNTFVTGRTVNVKLTDAGAAVASELASEPEFEDIATRGALIAKTFGPYSGTKLRDFVYEHFPEVIDLKWGEEISL